MIAKRVARMAVSMDIISQSEMNGPWLCLPVIWNYLRNWSGAELGHRFARQFIQAFFATMLSRLIDFQLLSKLIVVLDFGYRELVKGLSLCWRAVKTNNCQRIMVSRFERIYCAFQPAVMGCGWYELCISHTWPPTHAIQLANRRNHLARIIHMVFLLVQIGSFPLLLFAWERTYFKGFVWTNSN